MEKLSIDLIKYMALYLNIEDIHRYKQTCKRINKILDDNDFWKLLFWRDYSYIGFDNTNSRKEYIRICNHIKKWNKSGVDSMKDNNRITIVNDAKLITKDKLIIIITFGILYLIIKT